MARETLSDALLDGDSAAWEGFVRRYGGLIVAATHDPLGISARELRIGDKV